MHRPSEVTSQYDPPERTVHLVSEGGGGGGKWLCAGGDGEGEGRGCGGGSEGGEGGEGGGGGGGHRPHVAGQFICVYDVEQQVLQFEGPTSVHRAHVPTKAEFE